MMPDDIETITWTKKDYDRNVEQLLLEKLDLQQRIDKAIEEVSRFYYDFDIDFVSGLKCERLLKILKGEEILGDKE